MKPIKGFPHPSSGIWTQGLALARQAFYSLNLAHRPFCFSYFFIWISCFAQTRMDSDSTIYTSHVARIAGGPQCPPYWLRWDLTNFFPKADLKVLSSWFPPPKFLDYRHEPLPCPVLKAFKSLVSTKLRLFSEIIWNLFFSGYSRFALIFCVCCLIYLYLSFRQWIISHTIIICLYCKYKFTYVYKSMWNAF
jgi:hypothetical protein